MTMRWISWTDQWIRSVTSSGFCWGRRVGAGAEGRQHGEGRHDEREVPVPTMSQTGFVVIDAKLVLGRLEIVHYGPAMPFHANECFMVVPAALTSPRQRRPSSKLTLPGEGGPQATLTVVSGESTVCPPPATPMSASRSELRSSRAASRSRCRSGLQRLACARERRCHALGRLALPCRDHRWMNAVPGCQLRQR